MSNDTKLAQKRNDQISLSLPVRSKVLAYRSVTLQRKKRMNKSKIKLPKRPAKGRFDDQAGLRGMTFVAERY